jgi:predicted nucleic acid-binding protein
VLADTTFLIDYLEGNDAVAEFLSNRPADPGIATSALNIKEVAVGEMIVADADPHSIDRRFGWLDVVPFSRSHASRAASMEASLREEDSFDPSLLVDVLTAAVAVEERRPVLTRNVSDFESIPDVTIETY